MPHKITLKAETAAEYEIVDYTGGDSAYINGHGQITFSKLTPDACAALLSRNFPFLKKKERKEEKAALPKAIEKAAKAE